MINSIPEVIYDNKGALIRVIKVVVIYYNDRQREGYAFHVEKEERVTSISEFDLFYKDNKYYVDRDIFSGSIEG